MNCELNIIVAVAENGVIGGANTLLWHISEDLRRFKQLTTGHPVIMGRKTYLSIGRPLPNRRNIVLSRKESSFAGCETFSSLDEALANCTNEEVVYIIGGEMLYRTALPMASILCLTEVDDTPEEADAFFPQFNRNEWEVIEQEKHGTDEKHNFNYNFVTYLRRE